MEIRFDWPQIYSSVVAQTDAPERLAGTVSQLIERDIGARDPSLGTMFGTSWEICQSYGIGRETLLQAVRLLEQRGVARMRRGPSGGLIIIDQSENSTVAQLGNYLRQIGTTREQLVEAKTIFSLMHMHERQVAAGDDAEFSAHLRSMIACHSGTSRLRGTTGMLAKKRVNPALLPIIQALEALGDNHLPDAPGGTYRTEATRQDLVGLAAQFLTTEIACQKARGNSRLGCEADLAAQFGVCRQVFRQAVRLLEDRGMLTSRRGRHNGLFVIAAHPTAVIDRLVNHYERNRVVESEFRPILTMLDRVNRTCFAIRAQPKHFSEIEKLLREQQWDDAGKHILRLHIEWPLLDNPILSFMEQALSAYRSRRAGTAVVFANVDLHTVKSGTFEHLDLLRAGNLIGADQRYVRLQGDIASMMGRY